MSDTSSVKFTREEIDTVKSVGMILAGFGKGQLTENLIGIIEKMEKMI
jgi:hypothetical protein